MAACPNTKCKKGSVQCQGCNGRGYRSGFFTKSPCTTCDSKGTIQCVECRVCDKCQGSGNGFLPFSSCSACEGKGQVDKLSLTERGDRYLQAGKYHDAKKYFQAAANAGDGQAMYNLGILYEQGMGVQRNHNEATQWFAKAKSRGHAGAKSALRADKPRNWKKQITYCNECKEWKTGGIQHKDCPKGVSGSTCWLDIEHFEVRCDKCEQIWPLENNILHCGRGHVQKTEYTKETLVISKEDKFLRKDGDMIYMLDHSGKVVAGRFTYKGQGWT